MYRTEDVELRRVFEQAQREYGVRKEKENANQKAMITEAISSLAQMSALIAPHLIVLQNDAMDLLYPKPLEKIFREKRAWVTVVNAAKTKSRCVVSIAPCVQTKQWFLCGSGTNRTSYDSLREILCVNMQAIVEAIGSWTIFI